MIEDILPRYQETANGTKKSFTLPFDIIDSRYIMVYANQTKQTSGFSINGQELVFDSAPVAGTIITVVRAIPIDWEDYSYGALNLDNIVTLIIAKMQTLEEQVSRSLKVNIYDNSTQTVEFFLQQLADAQSVLESAQDKLNMITSTSNSAIANIESAKEEAVQTVLDQVSIAESVADSIALSANKAQTILDSVGTVRDDAINTFNENATSKTSEYDSNASAKLSTFNSNADSRTTIFNTNAQTKMDSIDASVKSAAGSASAAAASAEKAASFAVDIAQNLDSPSANTIPSTQAVADESSRLTSIMGNYVKKSGDTMSGNLILAPNTGGEPAYILRSPDLDYSQSSTAYKSGGYIIFRDKNNKDGNYINSYVDQYGANILNLQASNGVDSNRKTAGLGVWIRQDGLAGSWCLASNAPNSILTTVNNQSDAVLLGNGLILNWGEITVGDGQTVPVVLKIPYSNTNYRVVFGHNNQAAGGTDFYHPQIVYTTKTTTGFSIYNRNGGTYHLSNVAWIAIGR